MIVNQRAKLRFLIEQARALIALEALRAADIASEVEQLSLAELRAGFDPNQPRDEYGRWTDTGAAADLIDEGGPVVFGVPDDLSADAPALTPAKVKLINRMARQYGIDPERVIYGGNGYKFQVAGAHYTAAGQYDRGTGLVTLYDGALWSEDAIRDVLSHELTHAIYHAVTEARWQEWLRIGAEANLQGILGIYADGQLDEALNEQFPIYQQMAWYHTPGNREKLRRDDGVTSYSAQYWKAYEEDQQGWRFELAINETLAEIASLKATGRYKTWTAYKISRLWAGYSRALEKAWKILLEQRAREAAYYAGETS